MVDDNSGVVAFLEVNPRMDSTAALPFRLRYDYSRMAVEIAERNLPAPLTRVYRAGKHCHWLYGDALSWLNCRRHGRQSGAMLLDWALRMLWSALTSHHLTWDVRNPISTLHFFWKKLLVFVLKRLPPALKSVPRYP